MDWLTQKQTIKLSQNRLSHEIRVRTEQAAIYWEHNGLRKGMHMTKYEQTGEWMCETGSPLRNKSAFPATINLSVLCEYFCRLSFSEHRSETCAWEEGLCRGNTEIEKKCVFRAAEHVHKLQKGRLSASMWAAFLHLSKAKWRNDTYRWQQGRGWATNVCLYP